MPNLIIIKIIMNSKTKHKINYLHNSLYLTISTAPALTFGSFPLTDILAVNEPSILNTTHSVFGGITVKKKSTNV